MIINAVMSNTPTTFKATATSKAINNI
jgi:hypothetical protein